MNPQDFKARQIRWRMVMGRGAEDVLGAIPDEWEARDEALSFLYDREYGPDRDVRGASGSGREKGAGSLDESQLTVPDWINRVHELFPKSVVERVERDALERYGIEEMVTNPELLRRAQPSATLLKAVLRTKHLMNQEVLTLARDLVRRVVSELMEKLAAEIQTPFGGALDRRRRSALPIAKNFDALTTIRRNLRYYDPEAGKLGVQTPYFYSRVRRHAEKWQIIILVDQSGSMLDSVIHSAVTASIFWGIKTLKTHLCLFDTSVVDVTADCTDPVETLMKVQLGGGTDIGGALVYAASLVENPRRTIVVLITDFYEGAPQNRLLGATKKLLESGVTVLGLAALDGQAEPNYDRELAQKMVNLGAHVAAMTPGELAAWVAQKVG